MSKEFSSIDIVIKWGISLYFCDFFLVAFVQRWSNKKTKTWSLLPRNLTWNLKMMVSKRNLLFQGLLFRFHVKFQGCISSIPVRTCSEILLRSGLRECFTHRTPFWGEMLHLCWRMIPWNLLKKNYVALAVVICVYEYIYVSIYAPRI